MRTFSDQLKDKWAVLLLSGSLFTLAISNWTRPAAISAQGNGAAPRRPAVQDTRNVLNPLEDAFVSLAERVEPSVVTITATQQRGERPGGPAREMQMQDRGEQEMPFPFPFPPRGPRGNGRPQGGTGSGVIIRERGNEVFVLTNNHVVESFNRFRAQLFDKTVVDAELVGKDVRTDLAVLRLRTSRPLPAGSVARLGDSDRVKVGQWAIAIGSPLGFDSTLTVGVISAKGRELNGLGDGQTNYADLIQTDASINPGNSGGPLVNIDGEVVGINVAISAQGAGIGFAIPANSARFVSEQLIERGRVTRGYLGVQSDGRNRDLSLELRENLNAMNGGAFIVGVQPDGPADRAKVLPGDVIVRFGEKGIHNFTDLENAVAVTRPGSTIPLEIVRDRKPERLRITLAERPSEEELVKRLDPEERRTTERGDGQTIRTRFGATVRPTEDRSGMEVVAIAPGSPAAEAGMAPGDVIVALDRSPTTTAEAFQAALTRSASQSSIVARVRSGRNVRLLVIRP